MSIYMKLLKIQEQVKGLAKDKKSFSYSYVTGNKILDLIKPIMNEHKILLKQEVIDVKRELIQYKTKNGDIGWGRIRIRYGISIRGAN